MIPALRQQNASLSSTAPLAWMEMILAAVVLFFASGLFDPRLAPPIGSLKINDIFIALAAGIGWVLLFTRYRERLSWFEPMALFFVFVFYFYIGLNLFWTTAPSGAAVRYLGFMLVTGWACYLAVRFTLFETLRILMFVLLGIGVVSAVLAIVLPEIGTMHAYLHQGDWSGIYRQKNTMGRQMMLLIMVSLYCLLYFRMKGLAYLGLIVGCVVLIQTGSRTSYGLTLFNLMAFALLALSRRLSVLVLAGLGLSLVATFFVLNAVVSGTPLFALEGETLSILGMPFSFTGRFVIWGFAYDWIREHLWWGAGYDGFWSNAFIQEKLKIGDRWLVHDAHNGFIDVALQGGLIGLALFAAVYSRFLFSSVRRALDRNARGEDFFPAMFLAFFFLANFSESYLLKATSIAQLLLTYCFARLSLRFVPEALAETGMEDRGVPRHHGSPPSERPMFRPMRPAMKDDGAGRFRPSAFRDR